MNNEKSDQGTALSKYIWWLKKQGRPYELEWSIEGHAPPYKSGSCTCLLCRKEKTLIAIADPKTLLNSHTELLVKCHHRHDFELNDCFKEKKKPPYPSQ